MFRGSPIKRIGRDRFVRNVGYAIGNSGDAALLPGGDAGWRRTPTRWCATRRSGRWRGSVEALEVGAGERRRGRCRGGVDELGARPALAACAVAGLGERGAGLEQGLGQVGSEREGTLRLGEGGGGVVLVAERGGEERVGEGVVGLAGDDRLRERRWAAGQSLEGGSGAGEEEEAVGGRAGRGLSASARVARGEVGAVGGEPLARRRRRG